MYLITLFEENYDRSWGAQKWIKVGIYYCTSLSQIPSIVKSYKTRLNTFPWDREVMIKTKKLKHIQTIDSKYRDGEI